MLKSFSAVAWSFSHLLFRLCVAEVAETRERVFVLGVLEKNVASSTVLTT